MNREEVKSVITKCEHLTTIDSALKREATHEVRQLATYFKRFSNHLGVVMFDPESTIDIPFQHDIVSRTNQKSFGHLTSVKSKFLIKRRAKPIKDLQLNLNLEKDTNTFSLK